MLRPLVWGHFLFIIQGVPFLKNTPKAIGRGAAIILAKLRYLLGLRIYWLRKYSATASLGLSAVAVISAISVIITQCMHEGIVDVYGDEIDAELPLGLQH